MRLAPDKLSMCQLQYMDYFWRRNIQTDKGRRKFYTIQSKKHQSNRHPCRGLYSKLAFIFDMSTVYVQCNVVRCAKHILEARIRVQKSTELPLIEIPFT